MRFVFARMGGRHILLRSWQPLQERKRFVFFTCHGSGLSPGQGTGVGWWVGWVDWLVGWLVGRPHPQYPQLLGVRAAY